MNNDPSPTLPAERPLLHNQHREVDNDSPTSHRSPAPERQQQNESTGSQGSSLSPAAKEGLTKKLQFLMHLSLNLDALAYAELCILYYMDCSFFRLFIRWMAQTLFVSPKTEDAVIIVPNYHISAIVTPNLLCMFLHLISSPPEAGEASRGYLHGGILIDFIGQRAPSSRFTLILLDVVVLAIQCFMITVNIEKERIRNIIQPSRGNTSPRAAIVVPNTGQDHDSEERGVLRDAPGIDEANEMDGIELRPLGNQNTNGIDGEPGSGGSGPLRRPGARQSGQLEGLADVLRSGNAVIGNFNVPQSLRTAWDSRENTPESTAAYALQNVGYNATLAALAAQRRARLTSTQQRRS